jgi:hypothetical protein
MAALPDHLGKLSQRSHLRIDVAPRTQVAQVFALHGFSLYEHRVVIVGRAPGRRSSPIRGRCAS